VKDMGEGARSGLHFGLTSGVITTLGLVVGLHAGTNSLQAVAGGIITIAVADAMADALGIHISKESERNISVREVWHATGATFLAKFFMAVTFLVPILLLPLSAAVIVSVLWGVFVVAWLSYRMARAHGEPVLPVVGEHVGIAVLVVVITHYLGVFIAYAFV
jgi:VIT1/CCC1 family predicted Fe2+/Mn2+ transporter